MGLDRWQTVSQAVRRDILLGAAAIVWIALGLGAAQGGETPAAGPAGAAAVAPAHIVGNSYIFYNGGVDRHLRAMAAERLGRSPETLAVSAATRGGARLLAHPPEAFRPPHGEPGIVVLQGHSTAGTRIETAQLFREGVAAARRALPPGARLALYLTPAYAPGHAAYDPAMLERTETLYRETAREVGALVVPVGRAFAATARAHPDIPLHIPGDWSHPSREGTYLAAAVTLAALWGLSPVGLGYDMEGSIAADHARALQRVAWSTATGAPAAPAATTATAAIADTAAMRP